MASALTNGGMLRLIFPNYIYRQYEKFTYVYVDEKHIQKHKYLVAYSNKWWNKPYQVQEDMQNSDNGTS